MAKKQRTTDQKLDYIERLSDQYQVQVNITRAPGVWIANARMADGRQFTVQSPADQAALLDDLLAAIERAIGTSGVTA